MAAKLWKHQQAAVDFIKPLRAGGLFMGMGAGKTVTTLELLREWQSKIILVVAPKAVLPVWDRETHKHFNGHFKTVILSGPKRGDVALQALRGQRYPLMLITNYESVWREPLASLFQKKPPDVIVADEAHKIKAPGGKASKFLSKLGKLAYRRLALTGTILPHGPLDAYATYRFLDPKIFGFSFTRFRNRYAIMGGYLNHEIKGWQNLEELHEKMYQIAFRVRSEDVLDLPPTLDVILSCELNNTALKTYKKLEKDFIAEIEEGKIVSAANAVVKLLRLQQLTGGNLKTDEGEVIRCDWGKEDLLRELIEGIGKEKIVIFGRFHHDLDTVHLVAKELKLYSVELSGRDNKVDEFTHGSAQVIAVQIQSGGLGIDLTCARYCAFISHGWSLGDYEQARARVHRPGQNRPVTYYHLVAEGTVDEKIMKGLEKKADLVKYVVDELGGK